MALMIGVIQVLPIIQAEDGKHRLQVLPSTIINPVMVQIGIFCIYKIMLNLPSPPRRFPNQARLLWAHLADCCSAAVASLKCLQISDNQRLAFNKHLLTALRKALTVEN